MLMRTTARRIAAVLMVALVAMLLVATGGSARAAHQRVSIGSGHVSSGQPAGRHTLDVAAAHHEQVSLHLDLHAALPSSLIDPADPGTYEIDAVTSAATEGDVIAPLGRAPPAP